MKKQISLYESGNELAAMAAKQINYHVMGYYPITPVDADRRKPRSHESPGTA